MKPIKNRYHCPACGHPKMLFASKKEAIAFLAFNADEIEAETGKRPVRAYFCHSCGGWHVTSRRYSMSLLNLSRRFGEEMGLSMYNTLRNVIGYGTTIQKSIQRKLKELRHNLKFEVINVSKCMGMITELISVLEVIVMAKLEREETIQDLMDKFTHLCDIFLYKRQKAEAV